MNDLNPAYAEGGHFLPDFCSGRAVLLVMTIAEITAIVLALAGAIGAELLWRRLLFLSLYLQWIGLFSAAGLCCTRRLWTRGSRTAVLAFCYLLLLLITGAISVFAYWFVRWAGLESLAIRTGLEIFTFRSMTICAIVAPLALRYFYVRNQWQRGVQAQAEARFQALQARIRPHFLFNSLNSIAALISAQPEAAEETVLDLSELFRVSLRDPERLVPLAEELAVARRYLNIESRRLEGRLKTDWQVEEGLEAVRVPLLCLQPLVENAVYHGVQQLPNGGTVHIQATRVQATRGGGNLQLEVSNPVAEKGRASSGERVAMENIRERLRLIYGDGASLQSNIRHNMHRVKLSIPLDNKP